MNLFFLSMIAMFAAMIVGGFWYNVFFKKYFFTQSKPNYLFSLPLNYNLWLASAFSLFIVALVYATLSELLLFSRSEFKEIYYLLSLLIWLCLAAVQLYQAIQIKQPYIVTFIHFGFWLIVLILYAIIFSSIGFII